MKYFTRWKVNFLLVQRGKIVPESFFLAFLSDELKLEFLEIIYEEKNKRWIDWIT